MRRASSGRSGSSRTSRHSAGVSRPSSFAVSWGPAQGRKARYASHLVEALDLERVLRPLDRVLDHTRSPGGQPHLDKLATDSDLPGRPRRSTSSTKMEGTACRKLIDARHVVRSEQGDVQPSADDENAYLESHDWDEYWLGTSACHRRVHPKRPRQGTDSSTGTAESTGWG